MTKHFWCGYMRKFVHALQPDLNRGGTNCQNNCIHIRIFQHLCIHFCVLMNAHQFFYLISHLHGCCFHLCFSGSFSCQQKFSAQRIGRLKQGHFMPSFLKHLCCFHSGHSAADHPDFLWIFCFFQFIFCFMTDHRVSHTGNVRSICHIAESIVASLIAAHAVYDLVHSSLLRLIFKLRICQLCSSHDNQIHFLLCQDFFCQRCSVDPSHTNRQHACCSADSGRIFDIKSVWHIDRRHFVHGSRRNDISSGYVQHVYAMFFCNLAESDHILNGQSIFQHIILCVDPDKQRHSFRHISSQLINDLQRESAAILKTSAVFIFSVVKSCA